MTMTNESKMASLSYNNKCTAIIKIMILIMSWPGRHFLNALSLFF